MRGEEDRTHVQYHILYTRTLNLTLALGSEEIQETTVQVQPQTSQVTARSLFPDAQNGNNTVSGSHVGQIRSGTEGPLIVSLARITATVMSPSFSSSTLCTDLQFLGDRMDVLSSTIPYPAPPATKRHCGAYYKLVRQRTGHFRIHSELG